MQSANKCICIVVVGNSGSGKSVFVIRYLLNAKLACRFIFDPRGEYALKFKRRAARFPAELVAQIATGLVIFDPSGISPGGAADNYAKAFQDFCEWVFHVSAKIPGQKMLFVDEIWRHCSPNKIPLGLATIVQDGRKNGVGLITATQRPNRLNEAILNECTELVAFRLKGENARGALVEIDEDMPFSELPKLPDLKFIAHNLNGGGELIHQIVY